MAAEVRQAVDHSERLIEVLLILARNDQALALTDPLDLAAVAEDAFERRAAAGETTTATLGEAPVTGDGVLLERLFLRQPAQLAHPPSGKCTGGIEPSPVGETYMMSGDLTRRHLLTLA